jgi:glucosamine--fructose-6-phosphate aminotransferase (isomerizing)
MCGIVSVLSFRDIASVRLISALEKLEYRGYDSAGIAYLNSGNELQRVRTIGKVQKLKNTVDSKSTGKICIGHTRWATHGEVTESNAHPHVCNGIAIVHNGIIENYRALKTQLVKELGCEFESETDSEVIAKLIAFNIRKGYGFIESFRESVKQLTGTFAISAICENEPDVLLGAKRGSPMAIGFSSDKSDFYIASDAVALSSLADEISYLEDGDIVIAKRTSSIEYEITDTVGKSIVRDVTQNDVTLSDITKNGYETFMLKEIFEEPSVARRTYDFFNSNVDISQFSGIVIVACGTSYYAGLLAKYWIEEIVGIQTIVEIASEFRYKNPVLSADALYIFISQSGETIDTLGAMNLVKEKKHKTIAIVNVDKSSIARRADTVIKTMAGPEIGVASTKAFISQILTMLLLCRENVDISEIEKSINAVLNDQHKIAEKAKLIKDSRCIFYIGRGTSYPVALEGALKIKELSYISAEGYPAGELKHGPIAIIDENVYTVVIAPFDRYFEKTISNMQEILARHGKVLLITTKMAQQHIAELSRNANVECLFLSDTTDHNISPFGLVTAVHLLAYHTSKLNGYDIDKPRNLAKSVTVE